MKKPLVSVISLLSFLVPFAGSVIVRADPPGDDSPVVWDSPSADSWGSMPIGNGDIGANVWVEPSGDLVVLLSKSDAWDELSRLCKLGRLRIKLPSMDNFRQELRTRDGEIRITAGGVTTRVWIDAHHPVVHVDMDGAAPFMTSVAHETWRTHERVLVTGRTAVILFPEVAS